MMDDEEEEEDGTRLRSGLTFVSSDNWSWSILAVEC